MSRIAEQSLSRCKKIKSLAQFKAGALQVSTGLMYNIGSIARQFQIAPNCREIAMRTSTLAIAFVVSTLTRQASGQTRIETGPNYFTRTNASAGTSLPVLPMKLPPPTADGRIILNLNSPDQRELTIVPELQAGLTAFIAERGAPIAAVIVADAKSGSILAMAEGRSPESWGGTTHSALHAQFPAASLFKTVVTAAAFEIADFNDEKPLGLAGGCGNVEPTGRWLYDTIQGQSYMTMKRAFGLSCNSFYAKLAVNVLGLGLVRDFAQNSAMVHNRQPTSISTQEPSCPRPWRPPALIQSGDSQPASAW